MQTLHKVIYTKSRSDTIRLHYLTDLHVGALSCDEARLRAKISEIQNDPAAYWIGGGDYIDAICRIGDKRHNEQALAPWLWGKNYVMQTQAEYVVEMLRPIAGKCLGMVRGNHERAAQKYYDMDAYGDIVKGVAAEQGIDPFELKLGVQGFVVLKFRRKYGKDKNKYGGTRKITVYCHHGWGGGRLPSGHAMALHRILGETQCDLALVGHRHQQQAISHATKGAASHLGGGKFKFKQAAFCGSYLNAWINPSTDKTLTDTYVDDIGMAPVPLGTPTITIKPDTRKIEIVTCVDGGWQRVQHLPQERVALAA